MLLQLGQRLPLRGLIHADIEALAYWMHPHNDWHKFHGFYYPKMPAERWPACSVDGTYYAGMGDGILRAEWQAQHPQGFTTW